MILCLLQTFATSTTRLLELTSSAEIGTVTFPLQKQILIVTFFHACGLETLIDSAAAGTF
jgi:hypothetical protein